MRPDNVPPLARFPPFQRTPAGCDRRQRADWPWAPRRPAKRTGIHSGRSCRRRGRPQPDVPAVRGRDRLRRWTGRGRCRCPAGLGGDRLRSSGPPPPRAPRWKRSNARAASCSDMPGPASETSSTAPSPGRVDPDDDGGPRRRVRADVAEQVRKHLADPRLVGGDHQVGGTSALTGRSGSTARASATASTASAARSVSVRSSEDLAVQPGQLEQLGDQPAHPVGLLLDAAHRVRQLARPERALPVQLRVTADGRQRRPELVAGVGGELPYLLLGPQPGAEGLLDPVQHRVDRPGQPADLLPVIGIGHPRGQVAVAGDQVGGARHPVQRGETAADQPAAARRQQRQQRSAGDQLGDDQAADLARDVAHGAAEEDEVPAERGAGAADGEVGRGDHDRAPDHPQRRLAAHRQVERLALAARARSEASTWAADFPLSAPR